MIYRGFFRTVEDELSVRVFVRSFIVCEPPHYGELATL
jgi:hypothetical protein